MSKIFYLDSCVLLAWLKAEEGRVEVIAQLFKHASRKKLKLVTSVLSIVEVLHIQGFTQTIPKKDRERVQELFKEEDITPIGMNSSMAEMSQDFVWDYGVKPKDGIHLATALIHGAETLYTYDKNLLKHKTLTTPAGFVPTRSVTIQEPQPPSQGELLV